jgi:hypothetical protein
MLNTTDQPDTGSDSWYNIDAFSVNFPKDFMPAKYNTEMEKKVRSEINI